MDKKLLDEWYTMKDRCEYKDYHSYIDYGGRGIKICDEWRNGFSPFACWAKENGYKEGRYLTRRNLDKDFCPENCKWNEMNTLFL